MLTVPAQIRGKSFRRYRCAFKKRENLGGRNKRFFWKFVQLGDEFLNRKLFGNYVSSHGLSLTSITPLDGRGRPSLHGCGHVVPDSPSRSFYQHAITIRIKPIPFLNRIVVRSQNIFFAAEGTNQHQQSRLRQMEIGQERTRHPEIETRINEQISLARS